MFSKQCGYGVSKQRGQWPYGVASDKAMKMASYLKPATSITLESIKESICMLLLKATFMASKALVASKQPSRPPSDLNSVTSITPGIHMHIASGGHFGGL